MADASDTPPGMVATPIIVQGQIIGVHYDPAPAPAPAPVPAAPAAPAVDPYKAEQDALQKQIDELKNKQQTQAPQSAFDLLRSEYPWIANMGISLDDIRSWVASGADIVAKIRQTPQYAQMFPAILRPDGTMRMSEAEYQQREDDYRQVLKQYGDSNYAYDKPSDLAVFFQNETDPNELQQRMQSYDTIARSSGDTKSAFYVYAGMQVTNDDLYRASKDPAFAQQLSAQYNANLLRNPVDYDTYITRATEAALDRTGETFADLEQKGALPTGAAAAFASQIDPTTLKNLASTLHVGSTGDALSLNELTHAVQYALIGSAATGAGLALPDQQRVEELRQAGIDRARAQTVYGQIAANQNVYNGALARAGLGTFTQGDFEKALFLSTPRETDLLNRAMANEKALGEQSGAAAFSQQGSVLKQQGLTPAVI